MRKTKEDKKCEYYHIHQWGEPPTEPEENGTIETEQQCRKKKGHNEAFCGGDLELCDFDNVLATE